MSEERSLSVEVGHDGVAWIRFTRGERRNALTWDTLRRLTETFEKLAVDGTTRACILTGSHGAFCAGADVEMMAEMSDEEFHRFCEDIQELTRVVRRLPFPVIAALDGVAVGAGCEIACLCDMRIGSDRIRLGFPEAKVGLAVTSGASWLLPRIVGTGWARRLLFSADLIGADVASRIGLVDEIVPAIDLEKRAGEIAARIAASSPVSVAATRALQNVAEESDIETVLREEVDVISRLKGEDEAREGLASFLEKRTPYWMKARSEGKRHDS